MISRLNELFGPDRKTRWRIILLSAAAIAAWGMVSEINGMPSREAENSATICGVLFFAVQVCVYCLRTGELGAPLEWVPRVPRRLLLTTVGATILAALPGRTAERFVLTRRLRLLTRGEVLTPENATAVGAALDIAAAAAIALPENVRVQVYRAVKNSAEESPDSRPFADAAGSVVRYTRLAELWPSPAATAAFSSVEARAAYKRGSKYGLVVVSGGMTLPTPFPDDAQRAISEFTHVVDLATAAGDRELLADALMDRATMYLYLIQPNDVLRDAEAAESNGQTDLSNIVDLEGNALLWRGGKEDLEQAVRLFRLLLQLPPSTRFLPGGGNPAPFRLDALGNLGRVSYKLGKFDDAIRDAEGALKLFYENQGAFQSVPLEGRLHVLKLAYLLIIASNLRLGKPNDAGIAASTWLDKSNDPLAQRIVFELGSGQFNAAGFLKEYEGPLVTPQAR